MENKDAGFVVDGIAFQSQAEAEIAAKETQRINYIRSKTNFNDVELLLQVYHKILEQNMFHTVVGLRFLLEIQGTLMDSPQINNDEIKAIQTDQLLLAGQAKDKVESVKKELPKAAVSQKQKEKLEQEDRKLYKNKFRFSMLVNACLILIVIVMFVLASTINSPTIINYKNEILDQYSAWEQELSAREQLLKEQESAAGIEE